MEMVKVIKTIDKLNGTEDEHHLSACCASHLVMREHGLLMSTVIFNRQGQPDSIETLWKIPDIEPTTDSADLQKGQRIAYLPKPLYEILLHQNRC